jgi:DNA-directed RNA polymerase specialized sigma subunit
VLDEIPDPKQPDFYPENLEDLLIQMVKSGYTEASRPIVGCKQHLITSISKKYQCQEEDMDDLRSEGTLILYSALESYRPEHGLSFSSFARRILTIRLKEKLSQPRLITLPPPIVAFIRAYHKKTTAMCQERGYRVSEAEVFDSFNFSNAKGTNRWQALNTTKLVEYSQVLEDNRIVPTVPGLDILALFGQIPSTHSPGEAPHPAETPSPVLPEPVEENPLDSYPEEGQGEDYPTAP